MRNNELKSALRMAVPEASPLFGDTIRKTLQKLADTDTVKESPMIHARAKRRTALLVLAIIVTVAIIATGATLLATNLFSVTMGDTPANAASLVQYTLAEETIGDFKVTVKEAAYDGMALYVLCSVRDMTATEPLESFTVDTGERYLTESANETIRNRNVSSWRDGLWIDGQYVSMPSMSVSLEQPGDENGELLYYFKYRLDQAPINLTGTIVEIALPIGEQQTNETLPKDAESGLPQKPDAGTIAFNLDCSTSDQVTKAHPDVQAEGINWTAAASQVVYSPLQLYITLDWSIRPEVLAAYIEENGDGYYLDGEKMWDYDAVEVCGSEIMSMQLVNADGTPVFETMHGFYGCGGVSNTQAWFTFPYAPSYPETMYLAPASVNGYDMTQAVQIR